MKMRLGEAGRRQALLRLAAGAALAALLAGCATKSEAPLYTGSIGNSAVITPSDLTPEEALAAVQKWGNAYSRDEKDRLAALNYAAALRAAGQTGQAVAVMRTAAIYHTEDREVLAAYGKALAADGKFDEALATVQRAQRPDNPDWQLLSAEGGILDSLNRHEEARARYEQALVLAPGEPQVLNNLGLSYLLTDELEQAEKVLREAAASPRATLKTKQNLALVLRLRGKQGEADAIAGPAPALPAQAAPMAQQSSEGEENTWAELAKKG
jgi:Flp pilus assembly protein TadD